MIRKEMVLKPHTDSWHSDAIHICGDLLPKLVKKQAELEMARLLIDKIDGSIIGNGEADFTKDLVIYEFAHEGKTFQLLDLPGIEGRESRYEKIIEKGIAKSHLVFYVNGTNKKPETATAQKIKRYLRREASVFAVCNIRGKADLYEFPEDRTALEKTHKDAKEIENQTKAVLKTALGPEVLSDAKIVQGLLAFSSLSYNCNNRSTCDIGKEDLIRAQNDYLKTFGAKDEMRRFSRIDDLVKIITGKLTTFDSDIIESNRKKVVQLLAENLLALEQGLDKHRGMRSALKKNVAEARKSLEKRFERFETAIRMGGKNATDRYHNKLGEIYDEIVDREYTDEDKLNKILRRALESNIKCLDKDIYTLVEEQDQKFATERKQIVLCLEADIKKTEFICEAKTKISGDDLHVRLEGISFRKQWGGMGKCLVTSFVLWWATIASGGTFEIVVSFIAVCFSVWKWLNSDEENIRELKKQARNELNGNMKNIVEQQKEQIEKHIEGVRSKHFSPIISSWEAQLTGMKDAELVLNKVVFSISEYLNSLKTQPHSTLSAGKSL